MNESEILISIMFDLLKRGVKYFFNLILLTLKKIKDIHINQFLVIHHCESNSKNKTASSQILLDAIRQP